MSREQLDTLFATVRAEGRAALMPFMTAGLPSDDAGVDRQQ